MSQGSDGSLVQFLDPATCDVILNDLRHADGSFPNFDSSDPGSPVPVLEAEVACGERSTQTSPVPTQDQSTYVLMVPTPVSVSDQATQVISRPHQAVSYTQTPSAAPTSEKGTEMPQRSTPTTGTQMPRVILTDRGTEMPPVLVTSSGCQAGAYFENEVIPPCASRSKLPWAYTYAQFDALLAAYPDVHPEDFVTYGIFQAQPRRGSYREWEPRRHVVAHGRGKTYAGKRAVSHHPSNPAPGARRTHEGHRRDGPGRRRHERAS